MDGVDWVTQACCSSRDPGTIVEAGPPSYNPPMLPSWLEQLVQKSSEGKWKAVLGLKIFKVRRQ